MRNGLDLVDDDQFSNFTRLGTYGCLNRIQLGDRVVQVASESLNIIKDYPQYINIIFV